MNYSQCSDISYMSCVDKQQQKKDDLFSCFQFWEAKTGRRERISLWLYIQMRSIQGKLDFSFISENVWQIILYLLGGINIQLWAAGAILHYKGSNELLHLLSAQRNDNFHFCSNVQTIAPRPFKTLSTTLIYTWKAINHRGSPALN